VLRWIARLAITAPRRIVAAVIGIGNRHGDERSGREATSSRTEFAAVPVPQGETGLPIGNTQDSQSAI